MGKIKEGWIVGNGSVNFLLKFMFRVCIMLELVGFFIDWFVCLISLVFFDYDVIFFFCDEIWYDEGGLFM